MNNLKNRLERIEEQVNLYGSFSSSDCRDKNTIIKLIEEAEVEARKVLLKLKKNNSI